MTDFPTLPLAGIVVLDFGQVLQGPYATLLMAQIEPPHGEPVFADPTERFPDKRI